MAKGERPVLEFAGTPFVDRRKPAVIMVAIVMLVKWMFGDSSRIYLPREKSARDILKVRYARGLS